MRMTMKSGYEAARYICERYGIGDLDNEAAYAVDTYEDVVHNLTEIDYTDMVFLPATRPIRAKGYDFVFVDEFQDCCELYYQLILKLLKPTGRLIVIGDVFQTIYGHSGADGSLFTKVLQLPNSKALPLSISYRCGSDIVKHAQKLVSHIEAAPNAHAGIVVQNGSIENVKDGDVILCRTNMPLVQACLKFIKDGRKATIKGSDIGRSLQTFIKPYEALGIEAMHEGIEKRHAALCRRLSRKYPDKPLDDLPEYQSMSEKVQILHIIADDCDSVPEVIVKIGRIFADEIGVGIVLSTVHKFKGLEAANVFVLEPQLIPFPYNVTQEWQKQQERNIDYVARTRAVHRLEYIRDWSVYGKKAVKRGVVPATAVKPSSGATAKSSSAGSRYMDVTDPEVMAELAKLRGGEDSA